MIKTIFAAGSLLFGGSAALGGSDTPIEPLSSTEIQMVIEGGFLDEACGLYSQVIPLFSAALDGDAILAMEITDAYIISMFETGFDPTESTRMTAEARQALKVYVHGCI